MEDRGRVKGCMLILSSVVLSGDAYTSDSVKAAGKQKRRKRSNIWLRVGQCLAVVLMDVEDFAVGSVDTEDKKKCRRDC